MFRKRENTENTRALSHYSDVRQSSLSRGFFSYRRRLSSLHFLRTYSRFPLIMFLVATGKTSTAIRCGREWLAPENNDLPRQNVASHSPCASSGARLYARVVNYFPPKNSPIWKIIQHTQASSLSVSKIDTCLLYILIIPKVLSYKNISMI